MAKEMGVTGKGWASEEVGGAKEVPSTRGSEVTEEVIGDEVDVANEEVEEAEKKVGVVTPVGAVDVVVAIETTTEEMGVVQVEVANEATTLDATAGFTQTSIGKGSFECTQLSIPRTPKGEDKGLVLTELALELVLVDFIPTPGSTAVCADFAWLLRIIADVSLEVPGTLPKADTICFVNWMDCSRR